MNVILNGPSDASAVPALARKQPLVLAPFLGRSVLAWALTALASEGVRQVGLETCGHAEAIRRAVGRGEAWGLSIHFLERGDSTPEFSGARTVTLDRLPQLPRQPLWRSYRDWQAAQLALLASFAPQRVGMREIAPGVFAGLRSQIAADAHLTGPCWIGDQVCVGAQAVIGADTIIEDGCYIDRGAEISQSIVGRQTYVGAFTELRNSFANENQLLQLDSGSFTTISDRLLLSRVRPQILQVWRERFQPGRGPAKPSRWLRRLGTPPRQLDTLLRNEAAT